MNGTLAASRWALSFAAALAAHAGLAAALLTRPPPSFDAPAQPAVLVDMSPPAAAQQAKASDLPDGPESLRHGPGWSPSQG